MSHRNPDVTTTVKTSKTPRSDTETKPRPGPDLSPWPPVGYITRGQMRAAAGGVANQTLCNWEAAGLIPKAVFYAPNRCGWPVDVARQALADLPSKVTAHAAARREHGVRTVTAARAAKAARRQALAEQVPVAPRRKPVAKPATGGVAQ